jgi:hypothetical protein
MPHMPTPVEPSPMGPFCRWCGQMPPVFLCTICGTRQGVYMPGMPAPQVSGWGGPQLVAPVVQAPQNASQGNVHGLMVEFARGAGGAAVDVMKAWLT